VTPAPGYQLITADARTALRAMPAESVHAIVTSPPYWQQRDYEHPGQIGLEPTWEEYVDALVAVFAECRRVLRRDGTLWLNLDDTYAAKVLIGLPWRVALALQHDGWWLRADNVWSKPNAMPESAQDRPTRDHEYVFLLTRSSRYFYDREATGEPHSPESIARSRRATLADPGQAAMRQSSALSETGLRAMRTTWRIPTGSYPGAHEAVMAGEVARRCILAGSPAGGTVLDPFAGAGTTLVEALRHGRHAIGIELHPANVAQARDRCERWYRMPQRPPVTVPADQLDLGDAA
jgi:DNA modification methylase